MSTTANNAEATQTDQVAANGPGNEIDIVKCECALSSAMADLSRARHLVEEMDKVSEQLDILRQRIVVWTDGAGEVDESVPDSLAQIVYDLVESARVALFRKYYTLGEKFVPINVSTEIENAIPF